jgi:hypothetical protein
MSREPGIYPLDERERGLQPLSVAAIGCTLVFRPTGRMYQPLSALAILAGLFGRGFTGVCECYIRPGIQDGDYLMGVGLAFDNDSPVESWWGAFADNVRDACADEEDVRLERDRCESTSMGELLAAMLHAGTAGFHAGAAVWVSDPLGPDPDSPFTGLCRRA